MSSFVRRIERQTTPSQPHIEVVGGKPKLVVNGPRKKFYMGRGKNLGVDNPRDKARIARLTREARRQATGAA